MPVYEYLCPEHGEFEVEHSIKIKLEFCPQCQEQGKQQEIKRLISLGGKGVVELSGNDLIAKVKADAKQLQRDASKNENLYSNLLGETRYNDIQSKIDRKKRRDY